MILKRRAQITTPAGRRAWVQYTAKGEGEKFHYFIIRDWADTEDDPSAAQCPLKEHPTNLGIWPVNVAANSARVQRTFAEAVGKHAGEPCYIVSTGPSIAHNWEALKGVKRGIIMGLNGTAVMPGIFDLCQYYCVMDGGPIPSSWGDSIAQRNGTLTSLFSLRVDKELTARANTVLWWRPEHDEDSPMMALPGANIGNHRTVTCSAVHLAYRMGCNPIVLVGQDCAFTDMMIHAGQPMVAEDIATMPQNWGPTLLLPGIGGRVYLTSHLLVVYKYALEAIATMLAFNNVRLVNASERGVLCEGIECARLSDVVDLENAKEGRP